MENEHDTRANVETYRLAVGMQDGWAELIGPVDFPRVACDVVSLLRRRQLSVDILTLAGTVRTENPNATPTPHRAPANHADMRSKRARGHVLPPLVLQTRATTTNAAVRTGWTAGDMRLR